MKYLSIAILCLFMGCNQPSLTVNLALETNIEEASDINFLLEQRLKFLDSVVFKIEAEGNVAVVNFYNKVDSNRIKYCLLNTVDDGFYKTFDNNLVIPLIFSIRDSITAINDSVASLEIKRQTAEFYKGLKEDSHSLIEKLKSIEGPGIDTNSYARQMFLNPLIKSDGSLVECKAAGFVNTIDLLKIDSLFIPYKNHLPENMKFLMSSAYMKGYKWSERAVYFIDLSTHLKVSNVDLNKILISDADGYVFVFNNRVFVLSEELDLLDKFYAHNLLEIDFNENELREYLSLINNKYLKVQKLEIKRNISQ